MEQSHVQARALRIEPFTMTDVQLIEADELAFATQRRLGLIERELQQALRRAAAGIGPVHHRRRYADNAGRPGCAFDRSRQRMRRVFLARPRRGGIHIDQQPAAFDLAREGWNGVGFIARLAFAGHAMEPPLVPGAHDIVPLQRSLSQRAAHMVAGARDYGE